MATTLFPTSSALPDPADHTSAVTTLLSFVRGSGVVTQTDNTVVSLVTAANPQGTGAVAPVGNAVSTTLAAAGTVESNATLGASFLWVSPQIDAVTIAGTITANLRALESAIAANYAIGCKLYRLNSSGIVAAFAQGSNVTELGTSEAATSISLTPTSTTFASGDQIGLLVYYCSPSGSTSASGRTAAFAYNGTSSGASGDSFLTFTEQIFGLRTAVRSTVPFYARPGRPG